MGCIVSGQMLVSRTCDVQCCSVVFIMKHNLKHSNSWQKYVIRHRKKFFNHKKAVISIVLCFSKHSYNSLWWQNTSSSSLSVRWGPYWYRLLQIFKISLIIYLYILMIHVFSIISVIAEMWILFFCCSRFFVALNSSKWLM